MRFIAILYLGDCRKAVINMMDLTGQRFGRLVVLYEETAIHYKGATSRRWHCKCDCGKENIVHQTSLIKGNTRSCGCLRVEMLIERSVKHNQCGTRIYNTYAAMKSRCTNPNEVSYKNYGGRGIKICDEWCDKDTGFSKFYNWALNNGYSDELTIDRINVDGNYEPSNCRWVTYKEQNRNKRNNSSVTWKGRTMILKDWCELLGLRYETITYRHRKGWSVERMFLEPIRKR